MGTPHKHLNRRTCAKSLLMVSTFGWGYRHGSYEKHECSFIVIEVIFFNEIFRVELDCLFKVDSDVVACQQVTTGRFLTAAHKTKAKTLKKISS